MRDRHSRVQALARFGVVWCKVMHDAPMWPIHGRYECRTCGRHHLVPWAEQERRLEANEQVASAAGQFEPASV